MPLNRICALPSSVEQIAELPLSLSEQFGAKTSNVLVSLRNSSRSSLRTRFPVHYSMAQDVEALDTIDNFGARFQDPEFDPRRLCVAVNL